MVIVIIISCKKTGVLQHCVRAISDHR